MPGNKQPIALYLNNEPFNITSYFRSVTPDLVSRFGSSEQGQTNLDLLKATTQKSYRGGMFQRDYDDAERVSTITNAYFNKLDNHLYPTPRWAVARPTTGYSFASGLTTSGVGMTPGGANSSCFYKGYFYVTFQSASPGAIVNRLEKLDPLTGIVSSVALPSALENSSTPLRLYAWTDWILIGGSTNAGGSANSHTYDGTTFTASTAGFYDFAIFNEKLYGMSTDNVLYQITAVAAGSFTFTLVSRVGGISNPSGTHYFQKMIEYNGALYIAMMFGLYRYDGVAIRPVVPMMKAIGYFNFLYMDVYNGRLYYSIGNKLYKFDGTNIEMLQDFTDAYPIRGIMAGADRLWISSYVNAGKIYSDKFTPGSDAYTPSVFCYDDIGFFEYTAFTSDSPVGYTRLPMMAYDNRIFLIEPDIFFNVSLEERSNGYTIHMLDLDTEFTGTKPQDSFTVISSDIDCSYPSVLKTLNGILTNYYLGVKDGAPCAAITVEAQFLVNDTWSGWTMLWSSTQVASLGITNDYLLHDQSYVGDEPDWLETIPAEFRKIRLRTICEVGADDGDVTYLPFLSDQTIRYTLQSVSKLKWLLEVDIQGIDKRNLRTPKSSDGEPEDRSASFLRKVLYDSYRNNMPILMYDFDWTEVKSTGEGSFVLQGLDFIDAGDHVAIETNDGWINRTIHTAVYDDVEKDTTITFKSSGQRLLVGGADLEDTEIAAGQRVRRSHAVYIKDIRNERYIIDANSLNDTGGFTDIASKMTIEVAEI